MEVIPADALILLDEKDESIAQVHRREDDTPWGEHSRGRMAELGGSAWLAAVCAQLLEVAANWPSAVVVRSQFGAVEPTYAGWRGQWPSAPTTTSPEVPACGDAEEGSVRSVVLSR